VSAAIGRSMDKQMKQGVSHRSWQGVRLPVMALVLLLMGLVTGSGCSGKQCALDADCPAGRICRLGLCALNPLGGDGGFDIPTVQDLSLPCDPAIPGDLLLHEILADPGGGDVNGNGNISATANEFIEVVNISGRTVALSNVGLQISASTTKNVSLGWQCLAPNTSRVVFGFEFSLGLTNSGATVTLLVDGLSVDSHTYGSEGNKDQSLTRTIQLDPESGWSLHSEVSSASWSPGFCANGNVIPQCVGSGPSSPDALGDGGGVDGGNPGCGGEAPVLGNLLINEVLADPGTNDANGDGVGNSDDEFVEIVNISTQVLDLSGLKLTEGGGKSFSFPDGVCLDPQKAVVVFSKHDGSGDYGGSIVLSKKSSLSLNNSGDIIHILDGSGQLLAEMSYGTDGGDDQSLVRQVDLDLASPFVKHSSVPAANGSLMSPGRCQNGNVFPDC
jgi:hypothetical protein